MKPVWLLDVDGVVNAIGKTPNTSIWPRDQWSSGTASCQGREWPIMWSKVVVEFIREVHQAGRAEIRWHTTWQHEASNIETLVGLPSLGVADSPEFDNQAQYAARAILDGLPRWWKLPAAIRVVRDEQRPLLWADDDISNELGTRYDLGNLRQHAPLLTISPNQYTALTPKHLRQIAAWLTDLESGVMFKTTTCITIHCDECDTALEYDDYAPHFETEAKAIEGAEKYDWFTKGGTYYCEAHAPTCACDACDHTPPCGYASCRSCERHAHNAAPANPGQTTIPTREELITKATEIHNREGCGCDPKYLMSCGKFAAAILRAPNEVQR